MLLVAEICVVIAALAMVVIAVAAVRSMSRIESATKTVSALAGEVHLWIGEANKLTREAIETVASVRAVIDPVRRVAERFETLGDRTADLSAAVLEEVEPPLRAAVALGRGLKSAITYLLERWTR